MRRVTVSWAIPYTCQFASPDLVRALVEGDIPLAEAPLWAEYGATSPEEYAHWARRSCGVVCVKMVAEGLGAEPATVMDWVRRGLEIGGYITRRRKDRPDVEIGWLHDALARLLAPYGHAERAEGLSIGDLPSLIGSDRALIASVSSEIGDSGPITRKTGHLVVVYGVVFDGDRLDAVILHNPSGRSRELQAGAEVPVERFAAAFSGRGIVAGPRP